MKKIAPFIAFAFAMLITIMPVYADVVSFPARGGLSLILWIIIALLVLIFVVPGIILIIVFTGKKKRANGNK